MKNLYVPPAGVPGLNALAALPLAFAGFFTFFAMGWLYIPSLAAGLLFGTALSLVAVFAVKRLATLAISLPAGNREAMRLLVAFIAAGVLLRILWVAMVPPVQLSDFQDYMDATRQWLATGSYSYEVRGHILYAARPPGFPMLLLTFMAALGDHAWLPTLINLLLFVATALMTHRIAILLAGNAKAGLLSVLILALWPSSIAYTGLAASEPLSACLFTAVFLTFAMADWKAGTMSGWLYAVLAGVLTGYGALVKPQMQMLPFLMFLLWLAATKGKASKALNLALACAAMAAAMTPWAVRNHHHLGGFLAISSNGGDVFYRANNPMATGTFTQVGEKNLDPYLDDELAWSRKGFEWGKEWIKGHPVDFVKVGVRKVAIFLGDDASGVYWTLKRGHGLGGAGYTAAVFLSNAWWIGIWILALSGLNKFRKAIFASGRMGFFLWMILFFGVTHAIFESQSRYHMPMIGLLAVLAAMGLSRPSTLPGE